MASFLLICSVIKREIIEVMNYFQRFGQIVFCSIKSFFMLHTKEKHDENVIPLENYYPDKGKLPNKEGFVNKKTIVDLTIIIPMYNVFPYIQECLDSVLCQKTQYQFEVILIDDGSDDNTLEKVKPFLFDTRIRLICQKNAGQSVARNNGIMQSKGRYIMFVDADDLLLPNAVEIMLKSAEQTKSDIVEGCVVRFYDAITEEMLLESRIKAHVESNKKTPNFVLSTYGYSVAKVYKREMWKTLRYPEGYIFEDVITKFILRRRANQVLFIEDVVYAYRMNNPSSSSHNTKNLKELDSIWVLPRVFSLCDKEGVPRDDIFYLLSLNHIGLLNYITVKQQKKEIIVSCFAEMREQLLSLQDCRPKRIPFMFRLLERSILENNIIAWEYIADTINKYKLLKKWREIN